MSVYIERMKQMSSTHSPTYGNSSLTSIPALPYFLNVKGERISAPVLRSVATLPPGRGWPWNLSSIGLGSKLSTCDRPPFMNRKMTCLARAGWWRPGVWAARSRDRPTRLAKASMPKPFPMVHRAWRREIGCPRLCVISLSLQRPTAAAQRPQRSQRLFVDFVISVNFVPSRRPVSVYEQKLRRTQQHFEIPPERCHGQHLLLVLGVRAARRGHPGHHALAHLGLIL